MPHTSEYLNPGSITFLQLDGIAGKARDATHAGWIVVVSVTRSPKGVFTVSKRVDSTSLRLRECVASGKHLAEAMIDYPSGERYTLRQVILSNFSVKMETEEFSLLCESSVVSRWFTAHIPAAPVAAPHGSAYLNPGSIIFLQADGIAGIPKDTSHTGWIPVLSASPNPQNSLRVTRRVDHWSSRLREAAATGRHLREAAVDYPSGERFTMRDVIVDHYSGNSATEEMTLNFGSRSITQYRPSHTGSQLQLRIPG